MKTYTKEQLIEAMEVYYLDYNNNPSNYAEIEEKSAKQNAEDCINHLIALIKD